MYPLLFRLVLSKLDAERAHALAGRVIRALGRPIITSVARRVTEPAPSLRTRALGLEFPSPFGLAAGFDKNGTYVDGLEALGFGHVEVGTVTPLAQPGNPGPRLFRLVADRALINRMGFNNDGAQAMVEQLRACNSGRIIIGVNLGKNKATPAEDAVKDYVSGATTLREVAEYFVVNVSSPNTPGLRGLQELDALEPILRATKEAAGRVPLLVKIAPDLSDEELRRIAELAVRVGIDGVIATNTTISREDLRTSRRVVDAYGAGGLSGAPLAERSLEVLRILRESLPAEQTIISVGGVRTAEDVLERLDAGATLVQGYTEFLYAGPLWARRINRELAALLEARGPKAA